MNNYSRLAKLASDLDKEGFLSEGSAVDSAMERAFKMSRATDFTAYVLDPKKYPATTASDEVAELLGQGEQMVNNYHGSENYMAYILPNFLERLDWLSRKYKDEITDQDRDSLGKLERDLHQIAKHINKMAPV